MADELAANPPTQLRLIKQLLTPNASETDLAAVQRREVDGHSDIATSRPSTPRPSRPSSSGARPSSAELTGRVTGSPWAGRWRMAPRPAAANAGATFGHGSLKWAQLSQCTTTTSGSPRIRAASAAAAAPSVRSPSISGVRAAPANSTATSIASKRPAISRTTSSDALSPLM